MRLAMGLATVLLTSLINAQPATTPPPFDARDSFEGGIFLGTAVDSFAGSELNNYINPDDSATVKLRMVGGVDFAYRLFGDPSRLNPGHPSANASTPPSNWCSASQRGTWSDRLCRTQLWVYGETVHGVRSRDVDCAADTNRNLSVCKSEFDPEDPQGRFVYLLRNATSLEAFGGFRWELMPLLQADTAYPARLYLKAQAGFLTVAGGGGDVVNLHHVALGTTSTGGPFQGSYLEVGMGQNDLVLHKRTGRLKIDALLSVGFGGWLEDVSNDRIRPFLQITVDVDNGKGSDVIQSYFGLDYALGR